MASNTLSALLTDDALRAGLEAAWSEDYCGVKHPMYVEDIARGFLNHHATNGRDALTAVIRDALIAAPVLPPHDEPYVGWSQDLAESVVDALLGPSS